MSTLSEIFDQTILNIGMREFKHPIFYNAPVGIRFEIGGKDFVYLEDTQEKSVINPAYINSALERAITIYSNLCHSPNLLRIDGNPDESSVQEIIHSVCSSANLPLPHQQVLRSNAVQNDNNTQQVIQLQLFWDLLQLDFHQDKLLQEIIMGDIGGYPGFVSNVYFVNTCSPTLFHLYDDRGLDVVAADKEVIRPLYERFNNCILDYDREKIDRLFIEDKKGNR